MCIRDSLIGSLCAWGQVPQAPAAITAKEYPLRADSMPAAWQWVPEFKQTSPESDRWWLTFNDPTLNELINLGMENSLNVKMAYRRIQAAAQVQRQTRAAYFPDLGVNAGWQRSKESGRVADSHGDIATSAMDYFSLGLSMNWEIDVFGRVNSQLKADKAATEMAAADYDAARVSLAANIAKAYVQLRQAQAQALIAEANIANQKRLLDIAITRNDVGLVPSVDVVQARLMVASTQATLPPLRQQCAEAENEIALLCGVFNDRLSHLRDTLPFPEAPGAVVDILPADLLRRRPDVVAAERQLAQQAALLGVAKKDFLPTLSLGASIATEAHNLKNLFGSHSLAYSIAPQLSWTIFEGLARNARVAEAKYQMEEMIDSYNYTVMSAVQEVNNALMGYRALSDQTALLEQVVKYSRRELELETDRYTQGLNAYSDVVTAMQDVLSNETTLLQSRADRMAALISLYSAMGGGW